MKKQCYEKSEYGYFSYIFFFVIPPSTIRLMPEKNYLFESNHSIHPTLHHKKIYVEIYPPY
ncbi:hypothetical protein ABNX05_08335 [Lysinibacillus sp. M3]|uniref:Uncharacterized protein n=1 Tax=Lysinibacillus zambalensis TaxID=3160866 RepID=A0ABV1MQ34_9BACI